MVSAGERPSTRTHLSAGEAACAARSSRHSGSQTATQYRDRPMMATSMLTYVIRKPATTGASICADRSMARSTIDMVWSVQRGRTAGTGNALAPWPMRELCWHAVWRALQDAAAPHLR